MLQAWTEICHQILGGLNVKFTEECPIFTEKHVLVKLVMGSPLQIGWSDVVFTAY